MENYLGEAIIKQENTRFKNYDKSDWALHFIECYGGIDGSHHKDWVLDQVSRILNGTELVITLTKWGNDNEEYRISTVGSSEKYDKWVLRIKGVVDDYGNSEYDYEQGVAP